MMLIPSSSIMVVVVSEVLVSIIEICVSDNKNNNQPILAKHLPVLMHHGVRPS